MAECHGRVFDIAATRTRSFWSGRPSPEQTDWLACCYQTDLEHLPGYLSMQKGAARNIDNAIANENEGKCIHDTLA